MLLLYYEFYECDYLNFCYEWFVIGELVVVFIVFFLFCLDIYMYIVLNMKFLYIYMIINLIRNIL